MLLCKHDTFVTFLRVSVLLLGFLPSFSTVQTNQNDKIHKYFVMKIDFINNIFVDNAFFFSSQWQYESILTWSPDAYKWAKSSPLINSLTLLITSIIIALGTMSRVVLVTIRMYESTKLRMVSTCLSSIGSNEGFDCSPCS